MQRKIIFSEGEYYHIYNRGVEKRDIFNNLSDKERFLRLMHIANGTKPVVMRGYQGLPLAKIDKGGDLVGIGAYCFMPNHFHLLVREINHGGISKFMSKLTTAYSMYFNKVYDRTGALFEGPFKAQHVENDNHLKYLFCYIHLNPLKIINPEWRRVGVSSVDKAKDYLDRYRFSSYLDYAKEDKREEAIILKNDFFPDYFATNIDFNNFISEWMVYAKDSPW